MNNLRAGITAIALAGTLCSCKVTTQSIESSMNEPSMATLQKRLLAQPAITHPEDPFIHVFFEGGDDGSPYGFALDGQMTAQDWAEALEHVGYLCPYSDFKPGQADSWGTHRRDVAVRGGQLIGRQTGGSIMGLGNVRAAYAEPIALKMTHFFHDEEGDMGTPGGQGGWRLRATHTGPATALVSEASSVFDTRPGGPMATFQIEMGFYLQNYLFGGAARLLECHDENGQPSDGWAVGVVNKGGHKGTTHLYFESQSKRVESAGLVNWQAWNWQQVVIAVSPGAADDQVHVSISIPDVGQTTGALPRPKLSKGILRLTAATPAHRDERQTDLDDVRILAGDRVLADYDFEPEPGAERAWGAPIDLVSDRSGKGHNLRPTGTSESFQFVQTHGIKPDMFNKMRRYLVEDLLEVRRQHGAPAPEVISNWALNDRPGRLAEWLKAGFTTGMTDYYLYGDMEPGFANLHRVLHSRRTRWADADGSRWNGVWLGHCNTRQTTMTLDQWQSLATLAILDGNRWLVLFSAMSNGHFAPLDTQDRAVMATKNAEVLYGLAQVAEWFQPTAKGLADSTFHTTAYDLYDPTVALRQRVNETTGEAWFAAMRIGTGDEPATVTVALPRQRGKVINLASGQTFRITDGKMVLPLTGAAAPLYFRP